MARITIFSKNRKAIESCTAVLENLNHQCFSHHSVVKGFRFKYAIENSTDEALKIQKALTEWLDGYVDLKCSPERQMLGLYIINLPFEKDEDVPEIPKNRTYSRNEEGFITNPENWEKGLSLL